MGFFRPYDGLAPCPSRIGWGLVWALALWLVSLAPVQAQTRAETPALDPQLALTQYALDTWTAADGLSQNTVKALLQTRDGYLWIGTQEGLTRFDGLVFKVFDKRNTDLSSGNVDVLYEDPQGTLWGGTRSGGLFTLRGDQVTEYGVDEGTVGSGINGITSDASGRLWVSTVDAGLLYLEGEDLVPAAVNEQLPSLDLNTLHYGTDGAMWVGTRAHGLLRIVEKDLRRFGPDEGFDGRDVTALLQATDGTLWIGTRSSGLWTYRAEQFAQVPTDLGEQAIFALHQDPAGTVWVGVEHAGLVRLRDGQVDGRFMAEDGLASNVVRVLFTDREGSLWIGTDAGLNRFEGSSKFINYSTREGLGHDVTYSVTQDTTGAIWVGTEGGGVSRIQNGDITTFTTADGLPTDIVVAVLGTRDGAVWIGTYGGGLVRYAGGTFETFTTADGLPSDGIFGLYEGRDGTLWVISGGGLVRYAGGTFETFTTADGLVSDALVTVEEGLDGALWIGTYDAGLMRFAPGEPTLHLGREQGLGSERVLALHMDDEGVLWVGTQEGGLHRYAEGTLTPITFDDGLYNDNVFSILEDEQGRLWMTCNRGVYHVSKAELNAFARGEVEQLTTVQAYDDGDGLRTAEFAGGVQPAAWEDQGGNFWFPTSVAGIASIDPNDIPRVNVPPSVVVERILVNGEVQPITEDLAFPPGARRFEFDYAGLSFISPEGVQYRYRLDGYDGAWEAAGTRRQAFYNDLAPGTYAFRVMARNRDGVWSTSAAVVPFTLEPHFWQTPWFTLLGVLLLGFVGWGGYRLRVRHLKERQRELEQVVQERTHDLLQEKEKTEQALQATEEARREAERAKAVIEEQAERLREMDRVKNRFFSNISHEFRTPLTLNIGPLEDALTGVYGPLSAPLRRQLDVMLRNARRLLRLINQLLDLSKLESDRLKLRVRAGNVVPFMEGIIWSFTAFAEKKGVELRFEAEADEQVLYFDPINLEKVFFNLLSNAIKFTPKGGAITVRVEPAEVLHQGTPVKAVAIRIADTGPGIPEADLPHVFDRFHQVDGTVSRVQEGTGIGLSLVKELVELHGGTIEATSALGGGTAFTVTLPVGLEYLRVFELMEGPDDEDRAVSRGPMVEMAVFEGEGAWTPEQQGEDDDRPLLLIVDDNPDIRSYVRGCLQADFRIATARDGREGLQRIRTLQPSLVISDVMMPHMSGYELCRAVKGDPELQHIPVVLLTSRASVDDKVEGLEAGSDDYLAKPFSAKELRARVGNLIALRSQQNALRLLNQELQATNEALVEASEMKTQLLSLASHDMKNPLTAVREFSRMIKEEVAGDAHVEELLDLIHSASSQMLHLVTQLLDSAALESGRLDFVLVPVDLRELAEDAVERHQRQAEGKGQQIHFEVTSEAPVLADPDRMREAIDNFLSNAIKYSPPGKAIWVNVYTAGAEACLAVRDEGPGLSDRDKEKLFGKFQKLSARPTGDESSTGLGLSITKQIVEMHDGRVWAEGEPGVGSTFYLALPERSRVSSVQV